ncbi:MAG: amidohydrolase family protein, partial [Actinobacteria bacterium]|nr:amidohydrolase family protein [Actinomycetota bacterium]
RHLAPAGYYFEAVHHPVEAPDLVQVAMRELTEGARWVKLVADFPSAAARASASPVPEPTYDLEVVRQLVTATHDAGARVAAHVTTELAADLVRLGIDSIEHGTALDEDTLVEMARRGTAWTPTLCATLSIAGDAPEERQRLVAERRERFLELLPMAVRLGVPVLTGSDVVGSVPREIALLVECGLEPVDALRASTDTAMRFLGADAADAPLSIVTFDEDPREDPAVLTRPTAIVIGGVRVR